MGRLQQRERDSCLQSDRRRSGIRTPVRASDHVGRLACNGTGRGEKAGVCEAKWGWCIAGLKSCAPVGHVSRLCVGENVLVDMMMCVKFSIHFPLSESGNRAKTDSCVAILWVFFGLFWASKVVHCTLSFTAAKNLESDAGILLYAALLLRWD